MAWTYLVIAGEFEIGFTTSPRYADGFTRALPTLAFVLSAAARFYCLSMATTTIPLGTADAVWTGIGAAGTVLIGIAFFGEAATTARLALLLLLIGSIAGLKLV